MLDGVLELWPLESVRDVKVTFSSQVVPGKGFSYDRTVVVGGRQTNLYDLEKEVLASQRDPRLHFALNCGSESCPVLLGMGRALANQPMPDFDPGTVRHWLKRFKEEVDKGKICYLHFHLRLS